MTLYLLAAVLLALALAAYYQSEHTREHTREHLARGTGRYRGPIESWATVCSHRIPRVGAGLPRPVPAMYGWITRPAVRLQRTIWRDAELRPCSEMLPMAVFVTVPLY